MLRSSRGSSPPDMTFFVRLEVQFNSSSSRLLCVESRVGCHLVFKGHNLLGSPQESSGNGERAAWFFQSVGRGYKEVGEVGKILGSPFKQSLLPALSSNIWQVVAAARSVGK